MTSTIDINEATLAARIANSLNNIIQIVDKKYILYIILKYFNLL